MHRALQIGLLFLPVVNGCSKGMPWQSAEPQTTVAKAVPTTHLGFDRNDYPGDAAMAALHRTFAFTGYWILTTAYRVLGTGYLLLGTAYWRPGTGYWLPGTRSWFFDMLALLYDLQRASDGRSSTTALSTKLVCPWWVSLKRYGL